MRIGLPNALLYHKYATLWKEFFAALGCQTIASPHSNLTLLNRGAALSTDEACLPFKLFMAHVEHLKDKCEYVLIPRIDNFGKGEKVCVKFNALYDIVRNTLKMNILDYNVDVLDDQTEREGFVAMGARLGHGRITSIKAYRRAKRVQALVDSEQCAREKQKLESQGLRLMLVGHSYNLHDSLIGKPIVQMIEGLGGIVVYADRLFSHECIPAAQRLSPSLYWSFNKQLVGAAALYKDRVDGIVFITTFPCGPDSLVTELMLRRLRGMAVCNIVVDELEAMSGLETRIESFIDILLAKRTAV